MKKLPLTFFVLLLVVGLTAQTEKRIALIIGNSTYTNAPLKNPVNDANLMATTLQGLGFTVIKRINVTKAQLEDAVRQFSQRLSANNIALFYYAGHGIQANGVNYLIPIDAQLNLETDLKYEAVNVNFVVEEFQQYPQNTNIVILDACRDNPLTTWARGGSRGFKAISPSSGTIIAFATAEGNTANDGTGINGLFTSKLVEQIKVAQPIENVFKNTRIQVLRASQGKQSPQEWSMLTGNFQFVLEVPNAQNQTEVVHDPTLVKENYAATNKQDKLEDDFQITEEQITGTVKITSQLDGDFYFDGKLKGKFTKNKVYTLNNIEIGMHTLKLGYWNETIQVEKDKVHEVTAIVKIGTSFKGGIIAYILQPGDAGYIEGELHGIIAAPSDQSTRSNWETAIQLCKNYNGGGYSDWYLPSKEELNKLYLNKETIGGFADGGYWSRSEFRASNARYQLFSNGYMSYNGKGIYKYVRAVRAF